MIPTSGWKTYAVAALTVAFGLYQGFVLQAWPMAITTILGALGLGALRHAVSTAVAK